MCMLFKTECVYNNGLLHNCSISEVMVMIIYLARGMEFNKVYIKWRKQLLSRLLKNVSNNFLACLLFSRGTFTFNKFLHFNVWYNNLNMLQTPNKRKLNMSLQTMSILQKIKVYAHLPWLFEFIFLSAYITPQ